MSSSSSSVVGSDARFANRVGFALRWTLVALLILSFASYRHEQLIPMLHVAYLTYTLIHTYFATRGISLNGGILPPDGRGGGGGGQGRNGSSDGDDGGDAPATVTETTTTITTEITTQRTTTSTKRRRTEDLLREMDESEAPPPPPSSSSFAATPRLPEENEEPSSDVGVDENGAAAAAAATGGGGGGGRLPEENEEQQQQQPPPPSSSSSSSSAAELPGNGPSSSSARKTGAAAAAAADKETVEPLYCKMTCDQDDDENLDGDGDDDGNRSSRRHHPHRFRFDRQQQQQQQQPPPPPPSPTQRQQLQRYRLPPFPPALKKLLYDPKREGANIVFLNVDGVTGSGKTVFINSKLLPALKKHYPEANVLLVGQDHILKNRDVNFTEYLLRQHHHQQRQHRPGGGGGGGGTGNGDRYSALQAQNSFTKDLFWKLGRIYDSIFYVHKSKLTFVVIEGGIGSGPYVYNKNVTDGKKHFMSSVFNSRSSFSSSSAFPSSASAASASAVSKNLYVDFINRHDQIIDLNIVLKRDYKSILRNIKMRDRPGEVKYYTEKKIKQIVDNLDKYYPCQNDKIFFVRATENDDDDDGTEDDKKEESLYMSRVILRVLKARTFYPNDKERLLFNKSRTLPWS